MRNITLYNIVWRKDGVKRPKTVIVKDETGVVAMKPDEEGEPVEEAVQEAYKGVMLSYSASSKVATSEFPGAETLSF